MVAVPHTPASQNHSNGSQGPLAAVLRAAGRVVARARDPLGFGGLRIDIRVTPDDLPGL